LNMKTRLLSSILIGGFLLLSNITYTQVSGSGRAYDFNSSNISVPNSASLNMANITLEAWIKADTWAPQIWQNVIISKEGWASGENGYTLRCGANGSLSFLIGDGVPGWHEVASGPIMSVGQWYHVAGTYDGLMMRIYINGIEVATTSYLGSIATTTYNLAIGNSTYAPAGNRYFDGNIDEVRVWNTALPQATIRDYVCRKVTSSHPNYSNLSGYWNFDVSGPVVDQSPNLNTGTVNGATLINSSAPIGNASAHSYGGTVNLSLTNGATDSVKVVSSSTFQSLHIYRVDGAPLVTSALSSLDSLDQNHDYGVFAYATGAYNYSLTYFYGSNPFLTGSQAYGKLATRLNGSAIPWIPTGAVHDIPNSKFSLNLTDRVEARLAIDCPAINISPGGNQTFCAGDSVVLVDNGQATLHQWYDGGGLIAGATGSSLVVQNAGSYYVVANDGACSTTSATINVTINPNPVPSFGTLSSTFCENDADQIIQNGSPSGGTYSGAGITGNSFSPSLAGAGNHTLMYSVTDVNGCSGSATNDVQVNANPALPVITQNGADLCVVNVPGLIYSWFLAGAVIPGANSNCFTATMNGSYSVMATNSNMCSVTSAVYMLSDLSVFEKTLEDHITIYPNPTNERLTIKSLAGNHAFKFEICDAQGRILMMVGENSAEHDVDVSHFQSGIYFVRIQGFSGLKPLSFSKGKG
jgi:Concanavalin A-like lectin/glucanases superfamily/Secretion system C-terminal sorting domain/Ig-like domain CHU_C associated